MSNRCPICNGLGRVVAFGASHEPLTVMCPECAGLSITPASAEDDLRMYSVREITEMLLARKQLPSGDESAFDPNARRSPKQRGGFGGRSATDQTVELVDQGA